jgi:hypothetical protein
VRVPLHLGIVISVLIGVAVAVAVDTMKHSPPAAVADAAPALTDGTKAR